ncbi:hypothetical protein DYB28_001146 [Aphanomyces astaci]|uniref:RNase III domain-containing protein n=3 Tax=Aphanomyces astaci TaxID=112090 RepID=A0A397C5W0_APHAT|nr:hypothetical protein DYB36_002822 [Aphanomyces astaci]RHY36554.1 hypothetical protein DYB25_012579 [Aphanomyces astaci]RLO00926.1 hypothetical protein DYB28_001146 [Aphanomyces astaci]
MLGSGHRGIGLLALVRQRWRCDVRAIASKPDPSKPIHAVSVKKNVSVQDMHSDQLDTRHLVLPSTNPAWQVTTQSHFEAYANVPPDWTTALESLQVHWDWRFDNVLHLQCALTHFSRYFPNTHHLFPANRASNRSLEWLGDSVLNTCVASYLFQSYPTVQEGQLTQLRSALVNNVVLSQVAMDLALPSAMLLGDSIAHAYDHDTALANTMKQTLHASVVEALVGAVLLDQGMVRAIEFANTRVLPKAIQYAQTKPWDPVSEIYRRANAQGFTIRFERTKIDNHKHLISLYLDDKKVLTQLGPSFKAITTRLAERLIKSWSTLAPKKKATDTAKKP